jgi:hypothetical protein
MGNSENLEPLSSVWQIGSTNLSLTVVTGASFVDPPRTVGLVVLGLLSDPPRSNMDVSDRGVPRARVLQGTYRDMRKRFLCGIIEAGRAMGRTSSNKLLQRTIRRAREAWIGW